MKKFLAITTSLCATVCALSFGGAAVAFADTDEEISAARFYPKDFETVPTFENLTDYAAGGGKYLFLENNEIYEYGNERVTTYKNSRKNITNLYFEGEEFYYRTDDNCFYALANFNETENPEIEDFVSTTKTDYITFGNYLYYYNNSSGALKALNTDTDETEPLDDCTNIKEYGNTVYAVRTTNGNKRVLCTLNGTEKTDVKVKNFDLTEEIAVGNAYNALTSSVTKDLQFISLTNGAYMTEVKLDTLSKNSSVFTVGDTVKVNTADTPTALLLYTETDGDEGISIIAANGKSYLIHPRNTKLDTVYLPDDLNTVGTATAGYIYSSPFESVGTRITALPSRSVTILKQIRRSDYPELDGDFYLVEYEDGETTVRGYVRFGLISTFTFNEDPPVSTPDPDATQEDLIKPVVLVLIVLLLIAIAAGYLIYVGTSDKRKKKNADKTNQNN
ncbi:MAG: hypothetical protein K2O89_05725 [Clostridia bacterium]|nr:hypothetical protein [Clostridia bacterium]